MVKDPRDEHYGANITADGAVSLGCQSAFWMPGFKEGRIVACLSADRMIKGKKLMTAGEKRVNHWRSVPGLMREEGI